MKCLKVKHTREVLKYTRFCQIVVRIAFISVISVLHSTHDSYSISDLISFKICTILMAIFIYGWPYMPDS